MEFFCSLSGRKNQGILIYFISIKLLFKSKLDAMKSNLAYIALICFSWNPHTIPLWYISKTCRNTFLSAFPSECTETLYQHFLVMHKTLTWKHNRILPYCSQEISSYHKGLKIKQTNQQKTLLFCCQNSILQRKPWSIWLNSIWAGNSRMLQILPAL